jgi:hypothetical protein
MKCLLALSILMFASAGACFANDPVSWNAKSFSPWVGKYPTTTVNKKSVSILEVAPIKEVLHTVVPAGERKLLDSYHVETPITRIGNFIVINKCKPHDCPSDHAMVVVDMEKQRLWAGFFTRAENRTALRWYGNGDDYSVLPLEIQQEFRSRHGD